jgi:kumamolisin
MTKHNELHSPKGIEPAHKLHGNKKITISVFAPCNDTARDAYIQARIKRIAVGDLNWGVITDKAEYARRFGASKKAMRLAKQAVEAANLTLESSSSHNGELVVTGYVRDIRKLKAASGIIARVTGVDQKTIARHYHKLPKGVTVFGEQPASSKLLSTTTLAGTKDSTAQAFNPNDLMPIFNAPNNDGTGATIGIIALDGGFKLSDATDYAKFLGYTGKLKVKVVKINGATGKPDPQGADIETALDVDGSLGAPGATIIVCISVNTDTGFAQGIGKLIDLGCDIITISWGSAEANWTDDARAAMHAEFARAFAANVTVFAAAGDNDAPDSVTDGKVHTDYPASDPLVISMIGLWMSFDGKTMKIWNTGDSGSGGGVSDVSAQEDWEKVGPQVKSLNDGAIRHWVGGLSGPADPETGLWVMYGGKKGQVGGTSADGPIYAGMCALAIAARGGKRLGFFLPFIIANYANDNQLVVPVTDGNNGLDNGQGYSAQELTVGRLNWGRLIERLAA